MAWHAAGTVSHATAAAVRPLARSRFAAAPQLARQRQHLNKGAPACWWPIKQKYRQRDQLGRPDDPSPGTTAIEVHWPAAVGFAGGAAPKHWEPRKTLDWRGAEDTWPGRTKAIIGDRLLEKTRWAAVQMGLIYVKPEGRNRQPDPLASVPRTVRDTFGRIRRMNDEKPSALDREVATTFGKAHGAGRRGSCRA